MGKKLFVTLLIAVLICHAHIKENGRFFEHILSVSYCGE